MKLGRLFKAACFLVAGVLAGQVAHAQTRQWVPFSTTGTSAMPLPSNFPQIVEANTGGRAPFVMWHGPGVTTAVVGNQTGSAVTKLVWTSGSGAPNVTTPTVTNWSAGALKPRSIVRTPSGVMFMSVNSTQMGSWSGSGFTGYTVPNQYAGYIYISTDDGETWDPVGASFSQEVTCYNSSGAVISCTIYNIACDCDKPNPAVASQTTANVANSITTSGSLAMYAKTTTGSIGGYAIKTGALGASSYEIMQFADLASAQAYAPSAYFTFTQGSGTVYFGVKASASPIYAGSSEVVVNGSGAFVADIITYDYRVVVGTGCPTTPAFFGYSSLLLGTGQTQSGVGPTSFTGGGGSGSINNYNIYGDMGTGSVGPGSVAPYFNNFPVDGMRWWENGEAGTSCNTMNGYGALPKSGTNVNRRREKATATSDNTGFLLQYSASDLSQVAGGGVYAYRGTSAANTPPSVIMGGAPVSDSASKAYFPYPQETIATQGGMMAVVSSTASGNQPYIYVSENKPQPFFQSNTNMIQTQFGTTNTTRVAVSSANVINYGTSAAVKNEWNGRLVALGQDGWSTGTPSRTAFGLFVVATTVNTMQAVVNGTPTGSTNVSACSASLQASVSGEPLAKFYYWFQAQNPDTTWPTASSVTFFPSSTNFDANGNATITAPVTSSGTYRVLVAAEVGGVCYDQTGTNFGVTGGNVVTVNIITGFTVNASATSGCSGTTITLQAVGLPASMQSQVQWQKDGVNIPGATGTPYVATLPTVGVPTNVVYTASIPGCTGSTNSASVAVAPTSSFSATSAPAYTSCAQAGYTLTFARTVYAASGSTVAYRLTDGVGTNVTMYVQPGNATVETVGAGQSLTGTVTLMGDLSGLTQTTVLHIAADVTGPCGSVSGNSTWSITVTPPAVWQSQPSGLNNNGVSGFSNGATLTATLAPNHQPAIWDWQEAALTANPVADWLSSPLAGPWPGTVSSATTTSSTFVPAYFAAAGSLVPNGSFESAVVLGTDVTLNNGAAGLSIDLTTGAVTPFANKTTTAAPQTVQHGSRSLKVAVDGALRVSPASSYLVEVGHDPVNLASQTAQSKTTAWILLGDFSQNGSAANFTMNIECLDVDRSTVLGTVALDAAPVVVSNAAWTEYGYIVKTNGGANAANLLANTAYWRPVIQVSGTNGTTEYLRVDDLRVIPISANEESLLRSAGALNASNQVVAPTITALLGYDTGGFNLGGTTISRAYRAVPAQMSACGTDPAPSNPVYASSESRLTVLRNPYNTSMVWNAAEGLWQTTVCQGAALNVPMQATSGGSLVYEWDSSPNNSTWSVVSGATSSSIAVPTGTVGTTYYRALLTSAHAGGLGITENKITKSIKVVTTPPLSGVSATSGTVYVNSTQAPSPMTVTFTGGGTPTFQWASSPHGTATFSNIPGATSASFTPAGLSVNGSAIVGLDYQVTVTAGGCGSNTTAPSETVAWVPAVGSSAITSPSAAVVCSGNGGSPYEVDIQTTGVGATATVNSAQPVSVLWQYRVNGGAWTNTVQAAALNGSSAFFIDSATLTAGGSSTTVIEVQAVVTGLVVQAGGALGSTSVTTPIYTIAINPQINISADPVAVADQCSGTQATFTVGATGNGITYQWQELNPDNGSTWVNLAGATSNSITVPVLASPVAMNDDPSFEVGISNISKIAGSGTYAWDGTTPAAQGNRSVNTTGGAITLATPALNKISVDSATNYLILASVYSDTVGRTASLGMLCYDASGNPIATQGAGDLALYRPIPGAKTITVGGTTWKVIGGIVRGEGALLGLPSDAATFRAGTKSIQVVVSLEEGAGTGSAHLDNVRILPLTPSEANLLALGGGSNIAAYAQARMGVAADGNTTRNFQYRAVLGNPTACGGSAITSAAASVRAIPNPIFVTVPADQTLCADGTSVNLAVDLRGGGSLSMQWQTSPDGLTNWLPVNGANGAAYSFVPTNTTGVTKNTFYRLQVVSNCGTYFTRAIKVSVNPVATITSPISAPTSTCNGQTVSMSIGVSGGNLQWQIQNPSTNVWTNLVGATSTTYSPLMTLANANVAETRTYRVIVTTTCGALTSSPVTFQVNPATAITTQSTQNQTICNSDTTLLGVTATGDSLAYVWYTGSNATGPWTPVAGGNSASYPASPSAIAGSASTTYYYVSVTGSCGPTVNSQVFSVTVNGLVSITAAPPATVEACSGTSKLLSISATGTGLTYTWTETDPNGVVRTLPGNGPSINVPVLAPAPSLVSDPSFEGGIGTLVRIGGNAGSSLALDGTTAADGSRSIRTTGGAIIMRRTGMIPVDTATAYVLMGSFYGTGDASARMSLGFECYDATGTLISTVGTADNKTYRSLPEADGLLTPATWTPIGGYIQNEGAWNGGAGPIPFRPGTKFVDIVVSMGEGSTVSVGHLDNIRLIPVTSQEMNLLNTGRGANTLATYWEQRMGTSSSGQASLNWTYRVTVNGTCANNMSASTAFTMDPVVTVTSQPQDVVACSAQTVSLSTNVTAANGITYTWQTSTDQAVWQAIAGSNSSTYTFAAPTVSTQTIVYYRLQVISNCGAVFSRVVKVTVQPTPAIIADLDAPSNVCSGTPVTLTFQASGNPTLFWEQSINGGVWSVISGQNAPSLSVTPSANNGQIVTYAFRVRVSSACGNLVSTVRTVTVNPPTSIDTPPVGFSSCLSGNSTALTVAASGGNITYTWDVSTDGGATWARVAAATNSSLVPQAPNNFAGTLWTAFYRVNVTGACGTISSTPVQVSLEAAPQITTQPVAPAAVCNTGSVTLSFAYSAPAASTVSWEQSADGLAWTPVSGATTTSLTTTVATTTWFRGRVTTACSSIVTASTQVTVNQTAAITTQPVGGTYCPGDAVTMSIAATGTNLTYKWESNNGTGWQLLAGASSTLSTNAPVNAGATDLTIQYRVTVTAACGAPVVSSSVNVIVRATPSITGQPVAPAAVCASGSVTMSFTYSSTSAATVAWEQSPDGLAWGPVSGATATSLTTTISNTTWVRARVTSVCSSVTTAAVQAVVNQPAAITTQPVGGNYCSNDPITLTVAATGTNPTYKWESNNGSGWQTVAGTSSTLVTTAALNSGASDLTVQYRVTVTAACGASVVSTPVNVIVRSAPQVTTQLTAPSAICGTGSVTMSFAYTSTASASVAWEQSTDGFSWGPVSGATTTSLTATISTSTWFRAKVTGACTTITTAAVQAVVNQPAAITAQPLDGTYCPNDPITLTVAATGTNPTYKWESNTGSGWHLVAGTSNTLTVVAPANNGATDLAIQYRVTVTAICGAPVVSTVANVTVRSVPQITTQPVAPAAVCGSGSVTLSFAYTSTAGATVTWEQSNDGFSWATIGGANGTSYTGTITSTTWFRARVTTSCTTVVSSVVQAVVNQAAAITAQPVGGTFCPSDSVTLSVGATGTGLTYKWERNNGAGWQLLPDTASTVTYVMANATTADITIQYRVTATAACGASVVSVPVSVTVRAAPQITLQPVAPAAVCGSGSVTLNFSYNSTAPATITWEQSTDSISWSAIPGANGTSYGATVTTTTWFRGRVTTSCTTITTAAVQAVVKQVAAITAQPVGGTFCSGDTLALNVGATGDGLTYKWERNAGSGWQLLPDTTATVTYPLVNSNNTDLVVQYRVTVTAACGSPVTSSIATVTIHPATSILTQPQASQTICPGTATTLNVLAQGATTYQWQVSTDSGLTWTVMPGGSGASVSTGILNPGTYFYRVVVSGPCTTGTYSSIAAVVAKPHAAITQQPTSLAVCSGSSASYTITTNVPDANYQWLVSTSPSGPWALVTNAVNGTSRLDLPVQANLTNSDMTTYYEVIVTPNGCDGPITSSVVSLVVHPGTNVVTQPLSTAVCVNTPATMSLGYTGQNVTIQWQISSGVGFVNIPGATGTSVSLPTGTIGTYQVQAVLTGACGTVTTSSATLTVVGPTTITSQPVNATACQGGQATFSVTAVSASPTYLWERSLDNGATWTAVGSSSPTLTVIATTNAQYRVTVFGGGGCNDKVVSNVVTLSVNQLPQQVPLSMPTYAIAGKSIYFAVANGGPSYDTVSWSFNGQSQTGTGVVFQAPTTAGTYQVQVTATSGSCQSSTVWNLDVVGTGNGDSNQDAVIDGVDLGRLEALFGLRAGDPGYDGACDLNGDGVIDAQDEALLLSKFGQSVTRPTIMSAEMRHDGNQEVDDPSKRRMFNTNPNFAA